MVSTNKNSDLQKALAALDEADKPAEEDDRRYTHEEIFANLRRKIND